MAEQPSGDDGRLKDALQALTLEAGVAARPKQNYAFWGTQPVAQFGEEASTSEVRPSTQSACLLCRGVVGPVAIDQLLHLWD